MTDTVAGFEAFVISFSPVFTAPSAVSFVTLVAAWVQCLGRPTIRRLVAVVDGATKSASSYSRFFRCGRWCFDEVWRWLLVGLLVPLFARVGRLVMACDDTTCDKYGRRVAFAALFRDAVRSTAKNTLFHWSHCWVVLSMQVRLPLWKRVISFPVMARLYRKESDADAEHPFRTRQELALEMIQKVAEWLPDREIELVADGAYPCEEIVKGLPPNVVFTSRMRSDAAVYEKLQPPEKRKRGRPAQKGKRLPPPTKLAQTARGWKRAKVVQYGKIRERLIWSRVVLWWKVARSRPLLLVIVRDPDGKEKDDFFFTTDLAASPAHVAEVFASRWGIEEVFREGKQLAGFSRVQGWRPATVERQAPFALLVLSLVKAWYVHCVALRAKPEELPPTSQMLTALRMGYWRRRINRLSLRRAEKREIIVAVRNALTAAA
jgi:hypothetical protein